MTENEWEIVDSNAELTDLLPSLGYTFPQDITLDYQQLKKYKGCLLDINTDFTVFSNECQKVLRKLATDSKKYDINWYGITLLNYDVPPIRIKELRGQDVNKLVNVDCVVRKVYEVKQEYYKVAFVCAICGTTYPLCDAYMGKPVFPADKPTCPKEPPHKVKYAIDPQHSIYRDVQRLVVQEIRTDYGKQPKSIDIYVYGKLCEKLSPGNRCTITGQVKAHEDSDGYIRTYIEACNIVKDVDDYTEIEVTEDDIKIIKELAQRDDVYDMWKDSINPSIYGYDNVKLALALQMFGGVGVTYDDGSHQRGDSHILLCGDPSMAKSQLIRSISAIVPRGVYASGRSTSGAGLTASAIHDKEDDKWYLEAGAMVLANGGMCIIDELDKMRDEDRSALHEAMESQTISVNKAGISEKLDTMCSILAAANPKGSKFNIEEGNFIEQIDLPASLMSRFDLIFMLYDRPNEEIDKTVATHVLNIRSSSTSGTIQRPISIDIMRKYITYAKGINPILSEETKEELNKTYVSLRKGKDTYITVRQLEALERICEASARLKLRNKTDISDARIAIELFKSALKELTLSETIDVSVLFGAETKREMGIDSCIKRCLMDCNSLSLNGLLQYMNTRYGSYDDREIELAVNRLKNKGLVYGDNNGRLMWTKN